MKPKIIFEDDQILVVDKPAGLIVNRSDTCGEETLQDQLSKYFNLGKNLGIGDRAGIVHRLDRETSGLLLVAKTQEAFENLQRQFKDRKVAKEYIALVHGAMKNESGTIDADIGRIGKFGKFGAVDQGRASRTDFKVVSRYQLRESCFNVLISVGRTSIDSVRFSDISGSPLKLCLRRMADIHQNILTRPRINYLRHHAEDYTLLHLFPRTGRTHQVRVHLKSIGHPVVSDLIYTPQKLLKFDLSWCPRLFLHAQSLEFINPVSGKGLKLTCDLPKDLQEALGFLTIDN